MKIRLRDIIDSIDALNQVANLEKLLKVKVAYHTGKQLAKIQKEIKYFFEKNNVLVEKYHTGYNESGAFVDPSSPQFAEFLKEKKELLEMEVELNIQKISFSEFADKEGNFLLSIGTIAVLDWLDSGAAPEEPISGEIPPELEKIPAAEG